MADRTLNGLKIPTVTSLGAAGSRGRLRTLSSDSKLYYDTGSVWLNVSGGIVVGDPVSGGGANRVLYENGSQNLATSANFIFDGTGSVDLGSARFGEWAGGGGYAAFGHKTALTSSANNYALLQSSGGATYFNTVSGGSLAFRIGNVDQFVINDGYSGFNATPDTAVAIWLEPDTASQYGLLIRGKSSQAAPLLELRDSGNATLAQFDENGYLTVPNITSSFLSVTDGSAPEIRLGNGADEFLVLKFTIGDTLGIWIEDGVSYTGEIKFESNPVNLLGGISSDLSPSDDDSYDIGSSTNAWAGIYLGPAEILRFGNVPTIYQSVSGDTVISCDTSRSIQFQKPGFGDVVSFDWNSLSASRTYVFPNANGTLALTSNIVPQGSDTQVQFNDGGAFGGDAGLTYNKSTDVLSVVNINVSDKIRVAEISSPSTPSSGFGYFYAKADSKPYFKNDGGVEYDLSPGAGGISEELAIAYAVALG